MAGARVSQCGGELAGRLGGDVHRESFGFVAESCSLPGLDQRDREPAQRSSSADTKDLPLARRQDGAALGRRGTAHDRTEFSKDYGLPRPLDAEGSLGGKSNCVEEAGGVKSFQPPLTSNDERDTFSFDHKGVHFIGLVNVLNLKAGGLGTLGSEQLEWLERDVKHLTTSTPIIV